MTRQQAAEDSAQSRIDNSRSQDRSILTFMGQRSTLVEKSYSPSHKQSARTSSGGLKAETRPMWLITSIAAHSEPIVCTHLRVKSAHAKADGAGSISHSATKPFCAPHAS